MTVNELINRLNQIKEMYPDSGKWILVADFEKLDSDVPIRRIRIVGAQLVFED